MNGDTHLTEGVHILTNTKLILLCLVLSVSDGVKCFRGPWVVPINGAAVNDGGELAAAVTELVTNG